MARALQAEGRQVKVGLRVDPADADRYQLFVFTNPHLSSELIPEVVRLSESGKRVIIDLDRSFHDLPDGWPGYMNLDRATRLHYMNLRSCYQRQR